MANEKFNKGRPLTVLPSPAGGHQAVQKLASVGLPGIESSSSNTNAPSRLFSYASTAAVARISRATHEVCQSGRFESAGTDATRAETMTHRNGQLGACPVRARRS